jgi:predicted MFS family arabinose efflux permease
MIGALVGTIWFSSLLILGSKSEAPQAQAPPSLRVAAREFASALRAILRRRVTWMGLGLALLGGTAYEGVGAMLGPFLLSRGLSEQHVGAFYLAPAVAAAILGSLAGGRLADRLGRARAVSAGIIGCVLIVFTAAGTDLLLASAMPELRLTQFTLLYVAIGVLTAASYALFMDLTDPRLGATQFSAFMGATNLCEALSAAAVGQLIVVPQLGYPGAFAIVSAASLVCLPLLWRMSDLRRMDHVAGDGGSQSNNAAQR